jgi:hypothetical protein
MSSDPDDPETIHAAPRRLWIRAAVVYLLVPDVLLVSGGDLGWWRAWAYGLLIVAAGSPALSR